MVQSSTTLGAFLNLINFMSMNHPNSELTKPGNFALNATHYDFIIIGAGSAGCVLANRLTEVAEWSVLLLEAGEEEPSYAEVPAYSSFLLKPNVGIDWGFRTEPVEFNCGGIGCPYPRGKVLGGSSTTNSMFYIRGIADDYNHWENLGNPGWGYNDVLKYFIKSENNSNENFVSTGYHGTGGPQNVQIFRYQDENTLGLVNALKEYGLEERDLNAGSGEGVMLTQMTASDGKRRSTNMAFLDPIRKRQNLQVITGAIVSKVLINEVTKITYGVDFNKGGTTHRVMAAKEVIISAGTINSPQILQLSGIGPKEFLQPYNIPVLQELRVGYNFHDHVCSSGVNYKLTKTSKLPNLEEQYNDIKQYLNSSSGPLSAAGVSQVVVYISSGLTESGKEYPDIEITFGSIYANSTVPYSYYNEITVAPYFLRPKSRGYVKIQSSDPLVPPVINPNYFKEDIDNKVLIRGLKYGIEFFHNTTVLKKLGYDLIREPLPGCETFSWGTDEYWQCVSRTYTRSNFHPVGTCKMGPATDNTAVVNHELKVYNIINLRVIDASVIPFINSGHTNAPAIMIAEKGADMIKNDWIKI